MNENEENSFVPHSNYKKVFFIQMIFVTTVILSITLIKYLSPDSFNKLKELYKEYFLTETSVSEVLEDSIKGENNEN